VLNSDHLVGLNSVTSGVPPQGSVLGPLLFSLFVNDLSSIVSSSLVLFADDAKICHSIQSDSDYLQLQQDLDNLFKWSQDWQLCFNVTKCKVLHISFNQPYREYRFEEILLFLQMLRETLVF